MKLGDALDLARDLLGRPLLDDEVMMVIRVVDAGKGPDEIITLLDTFERPVLPDEEVKTFRYEPAGVDEVREI